MKMKSTHVAILVIAIILGGVLILQFSGLWITEGKKVPIKITTGEFTGMADPSGIKGSYTFEDIQTNFGISPSIIAKAFALDTSVKEAPFYQAKDLELVYGELEDLEGDIGTDSIKLFVALYNGLPFTAEEETFLPTTAIDLLLEKKKITNDEYTELTKKSYTLIITAEEGMDKISNPVIPTTNQDTTIKGNTTFQDLINWGLTLDQIEKVIGSPLEAKNMTIKDTATKKGIEFSIYKNSFEDLLSSK